MQIEVKPGVARECFWPTHYLSHAVDHIPPVEHGQLIKHSHPVDHGLLSDQDYLHRQGNPYGPYRRAKE